jgi:hypothetical protein
MCQGAWVKEVSSYSAACSVGDVRSQIRVNRCNNARSHGITFQSDQMVLARHVNGIRATYKLDACLRYGGKKRAQPRFDLPRCGPDICRAWQVSGQNTHWAMPVQRGMLRRTGCAGRFWQGAPAAKPNPAGQWTATFSALTPRRTDHRQRDYY